ncbi:hypothetical protein [Alkalibacillus salilacus]|uniref:Uncharacterized protein n=1 Tax=Alkalibacillus salilacus TaxID=284582 RepID=A0ABT9VFJ5_9BACI|nr:hypothetical protein [Alkalibacillus salilacus]MDQ0159741.1 hypothetical protein [Alkalibacillus salilacus]
MIHTMKVIFPLSHDEVYELNARGINPLKINDYLHSSYPSTTFSIYQAANSRWFLSMVIDVVELLGLSEFYDLMYGTVESHIRGMLMSIFNHARHYEYHRLKRIDYKHDVVVESEVERSLLLHLYRKMTKSFKYQKLKSGTQQEDSFKVYSTTVYHSSGSVLTKLYDKTAERNDKGLPIKTYEQDVLRYEVSLTDKHIDYRANAHVCTEPVEASIKDYFKEDMKYRYFTDYLLPIYLKGDFYKIEKAEELINVSTFNPNMKSKLKHFLVQVSRGNLDTPLKKQEIKNMKTFNARIERLYSLNINPLSIPKNYKDAPMYLRNPLQDLYDDVQSIRDCHKKGQKLPF